MIEITVANQEENEKDTHIAKGGYLLICLDDDFRAKIIGKLEPKTVLKALAKAAMGS